MSRSARKRKPAAPRTPAPAQAPAVVKAQAAALATGLAVLPVPHAVLSVDIGGTHVKALLSGHPDSEARRFDSGPTLIPAELVQGVLALCRAEPAWTFDALSLGYPGPVLHGQPVRDPANLGPGWVGFDFAGAFGQPLKIVNDAAMQALGGYEGGKLLFLGLGTGLGSALIVNGIVEPLELAHLPYRKHTFEDYVGLRGLKKHGKKKWRHQVLDVIAQLSAALLPDMVVLGGGNAKLFADHLDDLPPQVKLGDNANAFTGGFRLWDDVVNARPVAPVPTPPASGTPSQETP